MFPRIRLHLTALLLALLFGTGLLQAATVSATLRQKVSSSSADVSVGVVIVSFNTTSGLSNAHLDVLRGVGIQRGITLRNLGMVAIPAATAGQVSALASNSLVRSIWSNDRLRHFMHEARVLTGVDRLQTDQGFTAANGGLPVSGQGNFSVVVNDSGIDATHNDLKFGTHVIQNVQLVTDTTTVQGFTPLVALENVPNTDSHVGHGTHVAGILGGTGQMSAGLYRGVAPGVKLIGVGSGYVLFILNALGGYEWSLANQSLYSIRLISNSWGSSGPFEPDNPINIATRLAYERNIISVFAGGNSGPGKDTFNPYAKAPWVISVAAGTKEGGLANFSSRGMRAEERLTNSDPLDDFNAPTITAPGTGREFVSNAGRFTAAIVSTRAATNIVSTGLTNDAEIPPAFVPFYTQISGTSMATPFLSGVIALMLDADPTLTPDEVKSIITQTASRMPGREDWEAGAGYINAYAAVDKVFNRSRAYGVSFSHSFNTRFSVNGPAPETIRIDYTPAALPGPGSPNSRTFTVQQGMNVLDVFAIFDNALETGDGNTIGILLTGPDGTKYSSGIALPILDAPTRQVIVDNPLAGAWLLEVRGVRGLAAAPNISLPTSGAALPGPVDIVIKQQLFTLAPISDIQGHPAQAQIESALKSRLMDTFNDGTFRPDQNVSRGDFADLLYINTALRQSLTSPPKFTDVPGNLAALAEAVTAKGSTLRDFNFIPEGMIGAGGTQFNPSASITRLDLAVALVRALGLDGLARSKAGQNVAVTNNGQTFIVADNSEVPSALRGYVQLALDLGILKAFFSQQLQTTVRPNDTVTRASMADALDNYTRHFVAGQ